MVGNLNALNSEEEIFEPTITFNVKPINNKNDLHMRSNSGTSDAKEVNKARDTVYKQLQKMNDNNNNK